MSAKAQILMVGDEHIICCYILCAVKLSDKQNYYQQTSVNLYIGNSCCTMFYLYLKRHFETQERNFNEEDRNLLTRSKYTNIHGNKDAEFNYIRGEALKSDGSGAMIVRVNKN